jgi:HSP20 family protein
MEGDIMSLLQKYDPFGLIDPSDFFESRWPLIDAFTHSNIGAWKPSIDVISTDDNYKIHADIPGVKTQDISITLDNNVLTIKGSRETETKKEDKNCTCVERVSGDFYRRFTLPDDADYENISAEAQDGVLELILPKKKSQGGIKIDVKEKQ